MKRQGLIAYCVICDKPQSILANGLTRLHGHDVTTRHWGCAGSHKEPVYRWQIVRTATASEALAQL